MLIQVKESFSQYTSKLSQYDVKRLTTRKKKKVKIDLIKKNMSAEVLEQKNFAQAHLNNFVSRTTPKKLDL